MQNGIFLFLIKNKVSKKRSILDPLQDQKKLADPDPITCDPGSRVHDPDPEAVIPDPIYLVTTLIIQRLNNWGQLYKWLPANCS